MPQRSFGWVQDASSFEGLKAICGLFIKGSTSSIKLITETFPLLKNNGKISNEAAFKRYFDVMKGDDDNIQISYADLVGQGAGKGSRSKAPCSGLAQSVLTAQSKVTYRTQEGTVTMKKPYQSDWSTNAFLRWAVSIGLLDYNNENDSCTITELGKRLVNSENEENLKNTIGEALLSYPPVIRILSLLDNLREGQYATKFELGNKLGFIGEEGFTSYPLNIWLADYNTAPASRRDDMKANVEGTSDKYARMICGWLKKLGWVESKPRYVSANYGGKEYSAKLNTFNITIQGKNQLKKSAGFSRNPRIPKIVKFEMLATKTINVERVRARRAEILKFLTKSPHAVDQIENYLKGKNFTEANEATINNDLEGFVNIGLDLARSNGKVRLNDSIKGLDIPVVNEKQQDLNLILAKSSILEHIPNVNTKYLTLIDLAFGGQSNSKEFELLTIDLLTNELHYQGEHLGGSYKPDNVIFYHKNGAIIDNKAYSQGYTLSRHQKDEMLRYIDDNITRDKNANPTEWWKAFPEEITTFCFIFISSVFRGAIQNSLEEIANRKKVNGIAISAEVLLYLAESLKSGRISYSESFSKFALNKVLQPSDLNLDFKTVTK